MIALILPGLTPKMSPPTSVALEWMFWESGIKLEFLFPKVRPPERKTGWNSLKWRNPNGILGKPSQHWQTPVQNKLEAWNSVDSMEVLLLHSSEDPSLPTRKWDVGKSTHTIEVRRSGLHATPLQAWAHLLSIALHSLASLWTGKLWAIYAETYQLLGYEFQKCHCANKSLVSHPAIHITKCKTQMTG